MSEDITACALLAVFPVGKRGLLKVVAPDSFSWNDIAPVRFANHVVELLTEKIHRLSKRAVVEVAIPRF